jgi:ferredoxin
MPYRIKIDRTLCSTYGECIGLAPGVFQLGDDNVSIVIDAEGEDDEAVLDAARLSGRRDHAHRRIRRAGLARLIAWGTSRGE